MSDLAPKSLHPEVRERLTAAVVNAPTSRRVAVFDYDHTCIHGDIGELFSQFLVDELLYRTDLDAFWELIDPRDGRDRARHLAGELRVIGDDDPARSAIYEEYRSEMAATYSRVLEREGKVVAYAWAVRLHVGLSVDEMVRHSERCVREHWARELTTETLTTTRGERVNLGVGLRRFAAIREVHDWLRANGFEVWIVSATNLWTVRTAARLMYGHDPAFAVGNQVEVVDGVLTDRLVEPALFREGKVGAIERDIGTRPMLVFGDSETDFSMMEWASELGVLIEHGDPVMLEAAGRNNWAVQPMDELELEGP